MAPSTIQKVLLCLAALVVLVSGIDTKNQNAPLSAAIAQSCDLVIEVSTIRGDCCSLNRTSANGCVLNVVNGQCEIRGQYWTIDWTSTFTAGRAKCPPSEFPELSPAAYEQPEEEVPEESAAGLSVSGVAVLSSLAAAFLALGL